MTDELIEKYKKIVELQRSRWVDSKNVNLIEEEMKSILKKILDQNPSDAIALTNLGALHSDLGKHNKALDILRLAENLNFNDSNLYQNIGIAMMNITEYQHLAKRYFDTSLQLSENEFTIRAYFDPQGH